MPSRSTPRYRVMVVDDSAAVRASLRKFLGDMVSAHFEVLEADNGVSALKQLVALSAPIDLLITDLEMPEMDGAELIRHLRSKPAFLELPILFLTSVAEESKKAEVFRLGATDYVLKPFLAPELEARILGYVERRRAFETLRLNVEQARQTQAALLPHDTPQVRGALVAAKYVPTAELGGDYYDFVSLPDGQFGVIQADVAGHGIAAALVSFLVAGILRHHALRIGDPRALLARAAESLHQRLPEGRYATALCAVFNPDTLTFTCASAGHPAPVLIRPSAELVRPLALEGVPLGLGESSEARSEAVTETLQPGDSVLFCSDALTEGRDGVPALSFRALKRFALESSDLAPDRFLEGLFEFGLSETGRERYSDDVTLLLLRINGATRAHA